MVSISQFAFSDTYGLPRVGFEHKNSVRAKTTEITPGFESAQNS